VEARERNPITQIRIVSERPTLNFVNTVDPREGNDRIDYLRTYEDLLAWAARTQVIGRKAALRLASMAGRQPEQAQRALQGALQLREAMYRIFSAMADHRQALAGDSALLRASFLQTLGHAAFESEQHSFRWRLREDLDLIRGIVSSDAIEVLESGEILARVKRCPGSGDCGWLFLDSSKNKTRRWCNMAGCGNRAKARRHLRRVRGRSRRRRPLKA
jgi:predicted RNA-binding Zn ribbon-like protein